MIWIRPHSLLCGLMLTACAPEQAVEPTKPTPQTEEQEKREPYKKPVRMNGRGEITSISFNDFFLRQQAGKALVFDARLSLFYRIGHIPGAINMPLHNCDERIHQMEDEIKAALAAGKIIVTYCSGVTCPDARSLARHFSGFGYPVSVFSGGWDSWSAISNNNL